MNILELLGKNGYNTAEYSGFSINEIDAMTTNSQLDMLVTNPETKQKAYIKFYFSITTTSRQIRPTIMNEIVEELYFVENVLDKQDTLIVIIDDEPNESIKERMRYLYDHDGIFVVLHNIKRLQFNILEHSLVPRVYVLSDSERAEFYQKYNIQDDTQLPEIDRFDPMALAICLRPKQVCKIVRASQTALEHYYYRICV